MANRLGLIGFLIFALALLEVATTATATTYTIGGSTGWAVPPNTSFYEEWVKDKTFKIGDSVVFNWKGVHNVLNTSKADYDDCTKTNGLPQGTSPVTFNLTEDATHYFICTVGPHCQLGQKVAIVVGHGMMPNNSTGASSSFLPSYIQIAVAATAHLSWLLFF